MKDRVFTLKRGYKTATSVITSVITQHIKQS